MDDRLLIGAGALALGLAIGMLLRVIGSRSRRLRLEEENRDLALRLQRMQKTAKRRVQVDRLREDGLTGLPNALAFRERLITEISRARRYERPLGVVLVSFDLLKGTGEVVVSEPVAIDTASMAVAKALADLVREQDTLGRLDDYTFALLLPETSPFGTKALADRLRPLLEGLHVEWDEFAPRVRPHVGVSSTVGGGIDADRMLRGADEALRASRAEGAGISYPPSRNRIQAPS